MTSVAPGSKPSQPDPMRQKGSGSILLQSNGRYRILAPPDESGYRLPLGTSASKAEADAILDAACRRLAEGQTRVQTGATVSEYGKRYLDTRDDRMARRHLPGAGAAITSRLEAVGGLDTYSCRCYLCTMGRPKGSKNRVSRVLRRAQYQIRLSAVERGAQEVAAQLRGLTWSEWARRVLRVASGLSEQDPREKGSETEIDTGPNKNG